jgi:hypothetical protein
MGQEDWQRWCQLIISWTLTTASAGAIWHVYYRLLVHQSPWDPVLRAITFVGGLYPSLLTLVLWCDVPKAVRLLRWGVQSQTSLSQLEVQLLQRLLGVSSAFSVLGIGALGAGWCLKGQQSDGILRRSLRLTGVTVLSLGMGGLSIIAALVALQPAILKAITRLPLSGI